MAITGLGLLGTGQSGTAGTTVAVVNTTGVIIPAGTLVQVTGCWDNIASVTAPTITCSTIGGGTATANHATAIGSGVTTTAGAGIWHQCFRAVATADIAIGATMCTLTSNQSAVKRAAHAEGWSGNNATLRGTVATGVSITGSPSVATAGTAPVAGDLVIGSASYENNALMTADADTLNGTWSPIIGVATTGGGAAANTGTGSQYKVVLANGAQTYNPTGGVADTVACVYTLARVPAITAAQQDFTNADWVKSAGATATASRLTVPASGVAKTGLSYTLAGERVFWKVTQLPTTGVVKGVFFLDGNNFVGIRVGPGANGCQNQKVSGGTQLTSPTWTWDPAKPYVSIREVGGTISFDRSADGSTWENISTTTTSGVPWTISGSAFQFDGLALTAGSAFIENFNTVPAVAITQASYGFYADGTESGSVALVAQDTPISLDVTADAPLLIRVREQSTSDATCPSTDSWNVQYELNASGTWLASGGPALQSFLTANMAEEDPTTNRLGAGTGSFFAGKVSRDGTVNNIGLPGNNYTEMLFAATVKAAGVADGDTMRLRTRRNGVLTGMTFAVTPTINVTKGGGGAAPARFQRIHSYNPATVQSFTH